MPAPTVPNALNVSGAGGVDVPKVGDKTPFVTKMNTLYARLDAFGILTRQFQDAIAAFAEQNETDIANLAGTIDLTALQQQIADVNALIATVTAAPEISTINGLREELTDISGSWRYNLIGNDGSFFDLTGIAPGPRWRKTGLTQETTSALGAVLLGHNGLSFGSPTSLDAIYYDSSTNGGAGQALSTIAQAFSSAMGRTVGGTASRYAEQVPIAQYTLGTGTDGVITRAWLNNTLYRFTNSTQIYRISPSSSYSFSFYFLAEDSDAMITHNANSMWIDGVLVTKTGGEVGGPDYKLQQGTVYHIAYAAAADLSGSGSENDTGIMYGKSGGTIHLCCPWIVPGLVQLKPPGRLAPSYLL